MKVYFTASIKLRSEYGENYHKIVDCLRSFGHEVAGDEILSATRNGMIKEVEKESKEVHRKFIDSIRSADLMVTEVSGSATSNIGYLVAITLEMGKPVIAMCLEGKAPPLLMSIPAEKFRFVEYDSGNLASLLRSELEEISKFGQQRFTMLLGGDILGHLDRVARRGVPRSKYIRRLIKKDMGGKKK